ncbi:MAG: hypothetical protein HYY17_04330 [Planctomycetes bacterium]|nr:hypothetical protein [Planctomycetota bacterium]
MRRIAGTFAFFLALGTAATVLVPRQETGNVSRFGILASRRWAYGAKYERESLTPVANPHPDPEPQPRRDRPFDVAVAGTKVYVALQGSELEPGHEVAVIDASKEEVVKRIGVGSSPYRLTLHPGGRFLVVTNRFSNFASVIDTRKDEVVSEIPLDFYAQGMTFAPDGRTAFVAIRYLDQVLVLDVKADGDRFDASVRELGGLDDRRFADEVHPVLVRNCGTGGCHDRERGGFVAGADAKECFLSALGHVVPGSSSGSRLLRAVRQTKDGGYADLIPRYKGHAGGVVVFPDPAVARWIDAGGPGPGIPVGNERSKPKIVTLSPDGRLLFVGNTGTQDISIVDTRTLREIGAIYIQNVVNDLKIRGRHLIVSTLGAGFGVARERDPYGGETWDRANPAAHFTVWRDLKTGRVLPKDDQEVLGPFDAVDGTAAIKFRDIQNDIVVIDLDAIETPKEPAYVLRANRYESHRAWVRYTSDTAESTAGDVKGDIPPDLMRVVGSFPEKMALVGDRLFVTMQCSNEVQEWRIAADAADPSDRLVPVAVHRTGMQPIGIAAAPDGRLFVANFLGGSVSVIDPDKRTSREIVVDPSVLRLPVPATNAERGEVFVHTALFSSDGDSACFHCHYLDMGDGRPWGVSQVVGQEYLRADAREGELVIGGTMGVPQMRGLFRIQPFFLEGTLSAFEARSMIMEHNPADDYARPNPMGDFTGIEAHYPLPGVDDVQSSMDSSTNFKADLEERRDEMFRRQSMRYFGKAFALRDFVRFVGEWQIAQPHLLPNPFDPKARSVERGRRLFNDPQVGCVSCHPPPDFTRKDFATLPPLVTTTVRDGSFTLIGMNRLDAINGVRRDLEPWDAGRVEERQANYTTLQLRGLWDRPPVFLHNGLARSLREVVATPGHAALGRFKYEPLLGGIPERPDRREVGRNETHLFTRKSAKVRQHLASGARIGFDTHGGTSHLTARQIEDLLDYLNSIE